MPSRDRHRELPNFLCKPLADIDDWRCESWGPRAASSPHICFHFVTCEPCVLHKLAQSGTGTMQWSNAVVILLLGLCVVQAQQPRRRLLRGPNDTGPPGRAGSSSGTGSASTSSGSSSTSTIGTGSAAAE